MTVAFGLVCDSVLLFVWAGRRFGEVCSLENSAVVQETWSPSFCETGLFTLPGKPVRSHTSLGCHGYCASIVPKLVWKMKLRLDAIWWDAFLTMIFVNQAEHCIMGDFLWNL